MLKRRFRKDDNKLHYCYVYGGKRNLNFHGWLNNLTIERLENEGCTVEIRDYEYLINNDEQQETEISFIVER